MDTTLLWDELFCTQLHYFILKEKYSSLEGFSTKGEKKRKLLYINSSKSIRVSNTEKNIQWLKSSKNIFSNLILNHCIIDIVQYLLPTLLLLKTQVFVLVLAS